MLRLQFVEFDGSFGEGHRSRRANGGKSGKSQE